MITTTLTTSNGKTIPSVKASNKTFITDDFLLTNETAKVLYHDFAKQMPIIDYHNHLPPNEIVENRQFANLTQVWLNGDHYKWRGMRAQGINERFITGNATDFEKFEKWAETVPYTMRNPLYHWTHLELLRYFGENRLLRPDTAADIFHDANAKLNTPQYAVHGLLNQMNVEVVCTTDDPLDTLEFHLQHDAAKAGFKMLPAFRPDKFILIDNPNFAGFIQKLGGIVGFELKNLDDLLRGLRQRADFFASVGCQVCDHGLEQLYAEDFTHNQADAAFKKAISSEKLSENEALVFKSAILHYLGEMYHELGWKQQFHLGALRNNNGRMLRQLGPDTGWDSIGDFRQAVALSRYLCKLEENNRLAQTIIYNLNPADNEVFATMIGNFNDGSMAGKIQWGSSWWFLDQKDGMTKQINTLSNMGLLSRFIGMLTDSRSFLSFPRHEYFRRLLCNLFGEDVKNGELPNDTAWLGKLIQDICYYNAKQYFNF
jgi:glucuronate isomerase